MPRPSGKKRSSRSSSSTPPAPPEDAPLNPPLDPFRTGMPARDSIIGVKEFKKGKKVYRIIETNEIDEYEEQTPPPGKRRRKQ